MDPSARWFVWLSGRWVESSPLLLRPGDVFCRGLAPDAPAYRVVGCRDGRPSNPTFNVRFLTHPRPVPADGL